MAEMIRAEPSRAEPSRAEQGRAEQGRAGQEREGQESRWSGRERAMVEETMIPSPDSVLLERTAESDFRFRINSTRPHIAELFHVNSKLNPHSTLTVPTSPDKVDELRQWYFETAYDTEPEEINEAEAEAFRRPVSDLPRPLAGFLEGFTEPGPATDLLYSLDLILSFEGLLMRVVPEKRFLWLEKRLRPGEEAAARASVLDLPPAARRTAPWLLFLVGCPWRYMLMYGPRGYRHTLMDAGRLLAALEDRARAAQLPLAAAQNFYDNRIDRFLFADGVERSALAVLALGASVAGNNGNAPLGREEEEV